MFKKNHLLTAEAADDIDDRLGENAFAFRFKSNFSLIEHISFSLFKWFVYRNSVHCIDKKISKNSVKKYDTRDAWTTGGPDLLVCSQDCVQSKDRRGCTLKSPTVCKRSCFSVMQVFFELQAKWDINLLQYQGLCQLFPVLFLTAQHLSPLLVLAFTIERYVSVCHPFVRERFWSTRRPLATVGVLALLALSINAVQAYFWNFDSKTGECAVREEVRKRRMMSKR